MKIAIAGCGSIAQVHAEIISRLPGQQLVAAADDIFSRAQAVQKQYGVRPYISVQEMLEQENIEVLHICTPHYLHTPMAAAALKKGIHVFLEKPPVISRKQWEELKNAAASAKGQAMVGVCFQNRFHPGVRYLKEQLAAGAFGKITGARGLVTWCRTEDYYTAGDWRGCLQKAGGGALINQAIHTLDLIQYLIDESPLEIQAVVDNQHLKKKIEVEDTMAAYLTYPSATACFYVSTAYVADAPPILELECETARIRLEDLELYITPKNESTRKIPFEEQERLGKSYWGFGHLDCIREFYKSIETKTSFPIGLEQIEATIWLMLRAYEAAGLIVSEE